MTFENGGAAATPSRNFVFQGSGAGYFWIWLVNVLLTIVTFGLFLPWALVRARRYFYENTDLEGRVFLTTPPDVQYLLAGCASWCCISYF
jgi:uncharacterized membrane protein YjgN (DUF898 family)